MVRHCRHHNNCRLNRRGECGTLGDGVEGWHIRLGGAGRQENEPEQWDRASEHSSPNGGSLAYLQWGDAVLQTLDPDSVIGLKSASDTLLHSFNAVTTRQ